MKTIKSVKISRTFKFSGIALFLVLIGSSLSAQLTTEKLFSSGMVLQRDMEIPVWGSAGVNDTVIVNLNGEKDSAITNADGKWKVILPVMSAGGPYEMTITNRNDTLKRTDVYIGDVFIAAGQSNMEYTLSQAEGGSTEIASANNQTIRQFRISKFTSKEPQTELPSGSLWTPATTSYVGNFTAVGYYFARDLQAEINVPIGIINAGYGGARIEAFMSDEMLGFDETFVILARGENERQPTLIFNAMINPIVKLPIKGFLWYQGESNADNMNDALAYGELFQRMIKAYREIWQQGEFPFLWVQLPNEGIEAVESNPSAYDVWPQLRAGQSRALTLPNTGEAITIDVGDVDIHPPKKEPVGHRLSLVARKVIYGEDLVFSGPRYLSHKNLENNQIKIMFDHTGSGLTALNTTNDTVHWFSLGKEDGTLVPAKAILDGDSVLVWNDNFPNPDFLRYAWEYNPVNTNLYNTEELPAAPFKIDLNFPGFKIDYFESTDTILERGSSALIKWHVYGAQTIMLNNVSVDSSGGMMIWPVDTVDYWLKAVSRSDSKVKDSILIHVAVIDPLPTIVLSSDLGEVVEPDDLVTITADAYAPGGGTVEKVDFYIDGIFLFSDNESPYQTTWTPTDTGTYNITGIVTNAQGVSVESEPLKIVVTHLILKIYEAENASHTGSASIKSSSKTSGGKYLDMTSDWTLTFSNIHVDEAGKYPLHIRYLLNYESPKNQNLYINGEFIEEIAFTAPNTSTWLSYIKSVSLNTGDNIIVIEGVWNWMSFDYIAIAVPGEETGLHNIQQDEDTNFNLEVIPNPLSGKGEIRFTLSERGSTKLELFDISGRHIETFVNEIRDSGKNHVEFTTSDIQSGNYLLKLNFENKLFGIKKVIITD